jgi:hypothetical protein
MIHFTNILERPKLVGVLVAAISLCSPFAGGTVASKLGFYFTVEATNDTWRQWTHSEVCAAFAWRASMLLV